MAGRLALVAALVATGTALGGGSSGPWRPHVWAAERYAAQRHGVIAFAVRTRTRSWGWHRTTTFRSASVVKAMLLVAYLRRHRHERLSLPARRLLASMIRVSDNDAALATQPTRTEAMYQQAIALEKSGPLAAEELGLKLMRVKELEEHHAGPAFPGRMRQVVGRYRRRRCPGWG